MNNASDRNVARPDSTWTLDQLQTYALARANQIAAFGRKTVVETWLFGESLALIRDIQKKEGTWLEWLDAQPYSPTTATNAIKLYQRITFDRLESCHGMTVSDLKASLGIIQEMPVKRRSDKTSQTTTEKCDHKLDTTTPTLKLVSKDSQDETDTTPAPEDQIQQAAQCEIAATDTESPTEDPQVQTETPAPAVMSNTAAECLHKINFKLAALERDLHGIKRDEHLTKLIDEAIGTLNRIRGEVATDAA